MPDTPRREPPAPLIWANALMFTLTLAVAVTVVPWYAVRYGFSALEWLVFALFLVGNGMAITAGYLAHRLDAA